MKLYMTRHGQTNYNELHLCNDDPNVDVYLTALGKTQASQVAKKLRDVKIDLIMVSPLKRTTETAEIINTYHAAPLEMEGKITDINNGFEGKLASEYVAARNSASDAWAYKPKGTESLYDVRDRVKKFLEELKGKSCDSVLVVTHQVVLRQVVSILRDLNREETDAFDLSQGDYAVFDI